MRTEEQEAWLDQSVGVRVLSDRAVLGVSGDDAREWLQGQLTNQLEGIAPGESVYGFVLTLKGRILGDAWVLARDDDFLLDVPRAQLPALIERLDRYIIMEDVDLEAREELHIITAQGPNAEQLEGGWAEDRLGRGGKAWVVDEASVEGEKARIVSAAEALGGGEVDDAAWERAHVRLGRPRFGVDFGEDTYPQESGLTPIAVSFNKGCYIGQETVVMLENRGKAPKLLWRWKVDAAEPLEPGAAITKDGTAVGQITSTAQVEAGALALGYLKRGHDPEPSESWAIGGHGAVPVGPVSAGLGVGK